MSWGPNANNPDNLVPKWDRDYYPLGPLLYICGHLCAVGTALYECKPEDKSKNLLILPPREDMVEVACLECKDSRAWVWEKEVKKWVRKLMPVAKAAPAVRAPVAPVVARTQQQQQQQQQLEEERKQKQLEKHMQLAREIEQLELEKKQLEEQLQKVLSLSK